MISFLRAIQPQLMWLFWVLLFIWASAFIIRKFLPEEYKKYIAKTALILSALAMVAVIFFTANFAVVNEVPRSIIDRSAVDAGKSGFEKKMKEEANKSNPNHMEKK